MAKLTLLFILAACLQAHSKGYAQGTITLSEKNATLQDIFKKITKQSGYNFIYRDEWLAKSRTVDIVVVGAELDDVLKICLKGQNLTYTLIENTVIIKEKVADDERPKSIGAVADNPITGRVTDQDGQPIIGANVAVKGTDKIVTTDANGRFVIEGVNDGAELEISFVGYEKKIIVAKSGLTISTSLAIATKQLDIAIVQAYGVTTRRLATGNISKVSKEEIEKQPVANPLGVLEGRVAGMEVVQSSGNPGAPFNILIRGNTSIGAVKPSIYPISNEPLFIIDGVPFAPNNTSQRYVQAGSYGGQSGPGFSPFASINPSDIESIEILKDADATAIYGSRGANGVVLITTKRGKAGRTKVSLNMYSAISRPTRYMKLLNTEEYLAIRREAFKNDGLTPTVTTAPDLVLYDTTRYTDFTDYFGKNTSSISNVQLSMSGGNAQTQFLLSTSYNREGAAYPSNPSGSRFANKRYSFHADLTHASINKRFNSRLSASYSTYKGNLTDADPGTRPDDFVPNYPAFLDSAGNLAWTYKGQALSSNPLAQFYQRYIPEPDNLNANLLLSYRIIEGLSFKSSFGYNVYNLNEKRLLPKKAINPNSSTLNSAEFSQVSNRSLIVEPQLEYAQAISKTKLQLLLGATWQQNSSSGSIQLARGFLNDDLLQFIGAVTDKANITNLNYYNQYKYAALFGRVNLNHDDKYILNLSGRRDGSSRFGPGKQFANFGAAGIAWLFSNENILKSSKILSFGKLRASYGTTGNDKIGDYRYLNTWYASNSYQGSGALIPTALFNPEFSWESNKKLEVSLDLGFLKDRILVAASWYRNRTENQLVNYRLPVQTGFNNILKNFNAVVENKGIEIEVNSTNVKSKDFTWTTAFNISWNKNKLVSFPDFEVSTYRSELAVGQPLSIIRGYHLIGVDPQSGVYQFEDINKNGTIDDDITTIADAAPKFFGGFGNTVSWKGIDLSLFFTFKKQIGLNYLSVSGLPANGGYNPPAYILGNYWQKPGDKTELQMLTRLPSSAAYKAAADYLPVSDGVYSDASFIRLKNVYLSYSIPAKSLERLKLNSIKIFLQAQNLLTITSYKGNDPENRDFSAMPPLQSIGGGLNLSF